MNLSPNVYIIEDDDDYIEELSLELKNSVFKKFGLDLKINQISNKEDADLIKVDYNSIFLTDYDLKSWGGNYSSSAKNKKTGIDIIKEKISDKDFFIPCILFSSHSEEEISPFIKNKIDNDGLNNNIYFKYIDKRMSNDDIEIDVNNIIARLTPYFEKYYDVENVVGIMATEQSQIDKLTLEIISSEYYKSEARVKSYMNGCVNTNGCQNTAIDKINNLIGTRSCTYHDSCYIASSNINNLGKTKPIFDYVTAHTDCYGQAVPSVNSYFDIRKKITFKRNSFCHSFNKGELKEMAKKENIIDIFKEISLIKSILIKNN